MIEPSAARSSRSALGWWAALAVAAAFELVGAWPVTPVEGDAEAIANGAQQRASGSLSTARPAYRFEAQPGTYALVGALHRATGWDPLEAFGIVSVIAALAFVMSSGALLRDAVGVPLAAGALAMLAVQETGSGGFYANSSVLAAAVFMAGLLLALRAEGPLGLALAGALVGLAGWFRADVVLVTPTLVPALYRGDRGAFLRRLAGTGAVALGTVAAASAISGVSPLDVLRDAATHLGGGTLVAPGVPWLFGSQTARSAAAFFAPGWGLAFVVGAWVLARERRWRLLAIVLLGTLPLWLVFGRHLSSPRYLYYSIPFLVMAGLAAARGARGARRWVVVGAVGLLAVQGLVGVRLELRSRPWDSASAMPGLTLFSAPVASGPVSRVAVAVGPGTMIPTDDGPRLSTGTFFAPAVWHRMKLGIARCDAALGDALATAGRDPVRVVTETWSAGRALERRLLRLGYRPVASTPIEGPSGRRTSWRRDDAMVLHTSCEVYGLDWDDARRAVELAGPGPVLYVAGTAREQQTLVSRLGAVVLCGCDTPTGLGLLKLDVGAARPGPS